MLTIEPRMATLFWACNSIYFKHMSFWYSFLESHLIDVPLKYRCPMKISNQIRHVHISSFVIEELEFTPLKAEY